MKNHIRSIALLSVLSTQLFADIHEAYSFYLTGDYSKSLHLYQDVLKDDPQNLLAYYGEFNCQFALQNFDQAQETLDKASLQFPQDSILQIKKDFLEDQTDQDLETFAKLEIGNYSFSDSSSLNQGSLYDLSVGMQWNSKHRLSLGFQNSNYDFKKVPDYLGYYEVISDPNEFYGGFRGEIPDSETRLIDTVVTDNGIFYYPYEVNYYEEQNADSTLTPYTLPVETPLALWSNEYSMLYQNFSIHSFWNEWWLGAFIWESNYSGFKNAQALSLGHQQNYLTGSSWNQEFSAMYFKTGLMSQYSGGGEKLFNLNHFSLGFSSQLNLQNFHKIQSKSNGNNNSSETPPTWQYSIDFGARIFSKSLSIATELSYGKQAYYLLKKSSGILSSLEDRKYGWTNSIEWSPFYKSKWPSPDNVLTLYYVNDLQSYELSNTFTQKAGIYFQF